MSSFDCMDLMWRAAVEDAMHTGMRLESRDGATREHLAYAETLEDVYLNVVQNPKRDMSITYASAEFLWYLAESDLATMILAYAPQYKRFITADGKALGHYGYRWRVSDGFSRYNNCDFVSQVDACIEMLKKQPNTRQCILQIWDPKDLLYALRQQSKDVPCTLNLQFILRSGYLHCITNMRSNDLWLGMPYDVFCFTSLQKLIAAAIGVHPGAYHHRAGSMHAYERNFEELIKCTEYDSGSTYALGQADKIETVWNTSKTFDYRTQVKAALRIEENARVYRKFDFEGLGLHLMHPVLADAAIVCAIKWCTQDDTKSMLTGWIKQPLIRFQLEMNQKRALERAKERKEGVTS